MFLIKACTKTFLLSRMILSQEAAGKTRDASTRHMLTLVYHMLMLRLRRHFAKAALSPTKLFLSQGFLMGGLSTMLHHSWRAQASLVKFAFYLVELCFGGSLIHAETLLYRMSRRLVSRLHMETLRTILLSRERIQSRKSHWLLVASMQRLLLRD